MNSNANNAHFYFTNVSPVSPHQVTLFHHHGFSSAITPVNNISNLPKPGTISPSSIVPKLCNNSKSGVILNSNKLSCKKSTKSISKKKINENSQIAPIENSGFTPQLSTFLDSSVSNFAITNSIFNKTTCPIVGHINNSTDLVFESNDYTLKSYLNKSINNKLEETSFNNDEQLNTPSMLTKLQISSPFHNDLDKGKMNIELLDNTIDHVLSLALSDNPCEEIFILPPRFRESVVPLSPTLRPSTPSSGINPSPAPSPLSCSPHPNHTTTPTQQSPSNICTSSGQSNYVDRNTDIQFQSSIAHQQYIHSSYSHTQAVPTILHVYPDSGSSLQMAQQHVFPNFKSPACSLLTTSTSQVVLRPAMLQNIQSSTDKTAISITQPINTMTNLQDNNETAEFSPVKINSPQTTITVPMTLLSPEGNRHPVQFQQRFLSDANSQMSDNYTGLSNSNVRIVQKTLAFGGSPSTSSSLFINHNPVVIQPDKNSVIISNEHKASLANQTKLEQLKPHESSVVVASDYSAARGLTSPNSILIRPTKPIDIPAKKRQHPAPSTNSKKRKTALSSVSTVINDHSSNLLDNCKQTPTSKATNELVQQLLDKLKHPDSKLLVSDPHISSFNFVLPPFGAATHPVFLCSPQEEDLRLREKGLKYRRTPFSNLVSRQSVISANDDFSDLFMMQHIESTTPIEPMLHTKKSLDLRSHIKRPHVCPSPKPISLENSLMFLYSGTNQSKSVDDLDLDAPTSLLPMFQLSNSSSKDYSQDRCTPPLSIHHMPNPNLLIHSTGINEKSNELIQKNTSLVDETPFIHSNESLIPVVDSETGEVLGGGRQKTEKELVENEKLHVTFTINSSMTDSVPEVIRRITDLLGIDSDSLTYQVTRSGTQITFGQKQTQPKNVIRDLESHLRQHFTPLSMHLTKSINECKNDTTLSNFGSSMSIFSEESPDTGHHLNNLSCKSFDSNLSSALPSVNSTYTENSLSISKLLALKRDSTEPCKYCQVSVLPMTAVYRRVDELASTLGFSLRSEFASTDASELIFCGEICASKFSANLFEHRNCTDFNNEKSNIPLSNSGQYSLYNGHTNEPRHQLIVSELVPSVPIFLQPALPKSTKRNALQLNINSAILKRRIGNTEVNSPKSKRWKGTRWRSYSSEHIIKDRDLTFKPNSIKALELLKGNSGILYDLDLKDVRTCALCHRTGDLHEDGPGRLLCYGVNEWIHLNCSLWCYEVYEAVCGSLNNERSCYVKAKRTSCTHCGTLGAGLPCYNPRCSAVYHVPCAQEIGCMFFTDRGMYCPQHYPREHHPMQLTSLAVYRRVYLSREENDQVAQVIHEEEARHIVRIGGLCLHSVGQLLPHQLDSGKFHNQRYIYPVGFRTIRIYWSMRRALCRGRYLCEVQEFNGAPNFVITAIDKGFTDESVKGETCDAAWRQILERIANLRIIHRLIKIFPQYNKGEDLFGLSEPHIVRAIESLPGVDQLRDYVFKFGRLQLIAEMPLAINPSGCARSEPKMRTYIKRTRRTGDFIPSTSTRLPFSSNTSATLPRNSSSVYLPYKLPFGSSDTSSRQSLVSRSQQYRRLKLEIGNNIILGRSRIQGLGLFAARDLDQHTMVIEYIGELIRVQLANTREKVYEAHNKGIYMFRLDEDTVIDATVSGGLARYINHSCDPNCTAEYVNIGEGGHIVILTTCKIHKGEELTYDYNFDLEDCASKIPCHCGAHNCRKWMN